MKLRFSLLDILLLTTVVALTITVVRLSAQLAEEKFLRRELLQKGGVLEVSDPDAVHVVSVSTQDEQYTWRWRVYVPPGRSVSVDVRLDSLPADKPLTPRLPTGAIVLADRIPVNPIRLVPGEHVVTLRYIDDVDRIGKSDPFLSFEVRGAGQRHVRRARPHDIKLHWLRRGYYQDLTNLELPARTLKNLKDGRTVKINDGETFVLGRYRDRGLVHYTEVGQIDAKVGEMLVWLRTDGG